MNKIRILFVEDDPSGREMASFNLSKAGYEVDCAASGDEGLRLFDPAVHSMVITDVRMPGISGMDVLKAVLKKDSSIPVVVITAYANVDIAVSAMKAGAFDFIGKPFNRDHLLMTVEKALGRRRLEDEVRGLRIRVGGVERPIVYRSDAMKQVIGLADRVATSDATVLVTGESGTGKELVARRIHVRSSRAEHPFVAVNAAAIPTELIESELFGHEKGAFTGASQSREGRFRKADKGTLFLDEIAEFTPFLQSKLLRVLQEKVVDVVGSDQTIPVDVRIVAATNRDLERAVQSADFREDLYYRLNIVTIHIPPLRERLEDIEPLVHHFVSKYSEDREILVPKEVIDNLCARPWVGNVRELENICQRLVILAEGNEISVADLPANSGRVSQAPTETMGDLSSWPPLPKEGLSLVDLEKRVIERVLALKGGNVSQAAAYLGVPRHVLAYRMDKYGVKKNDPKV